MMRQILKLTKHAIALGRGQESVDATNKGGWQPVIDRLVAERTSSAVKSALESVLETPAVTAVGRKRTRKVKADA